MQLLTAEEVKDQEEKRNLERQERIKKMNAEETKAANSLNETIAASAKRREEIVADLAAAESYADDRKRQLVAEIGSLEETRAELMKPIHEIREEAEKRLAAVAESEKSVADRERLVKEGEDSLVERLEAITDREQENEEKAAALNKREIGIEGEEKRLEESHKKLGEGWVEFNAAVLAQNSQYIGREKEIEDGRKANEAYAATLNEKAKQQSEKDREIKDRYETLGRAIQEHLNKKSPNP